MKILRHQDYRRMPWKNGMGTTEEVMAYPPDSDISSFGWRLSIAHVGADGPFSVFAGIDRTIALLDGDGLMLDLPDRTIELSPQGEPFAFSGDLQISSRNRGGPTIDLNIMTRRGQFTHEMQRLADIAFDATAEITVFMFNTPCVIALDGEKIGMQRFDALIVEGNGGPSVHIQGGPIDLLRVTISRQ